MDNYAVIIFVAVSTLFCDEVSAQLLRCRICHGAKYLDDCHTIETCSHDQQCYMDLKVTSGMNIEYWGGCRSKQVCATSKSRKSDVVVCSECCLSDDCNSKLCHLLAINATGAVRCWSCPDGVENIRQCANVVTCADNEMCYSSMTTATSENSVKHIASCRRKQDCTTLTMAVMDVLKLKEELMHRLTLKRDTPICDICCGDHMCNSQPCVNIRDHLYVYYKHGLLNNNTLTKQIHHP